MAIVHVNKTVGTTATLLTTLNTITEYTAVSFQNNDSASIFIGDSSVATSGTNKGHVITAGTTYQFWLRANDAVYAISAAGTAANAVSILYSQV
jgi:hypothetical protein